MKAVVGLSLVLSLASAEALARCTVHGTPDSTVSLAGAAPVFVGGGQVFDDCGGLVVKSGRVCVITPGQPACLPLAAGERLPAAALAGRGGIDFVDRLANLLSGEREARVGGLRDSLRLPLPLFPRGDVLPVSSGLVFAAVTSRRITDVKVVDETGAPVVGAMVGDDYVVPAERLAPGRRYRWSATVGGHARSDEFTVVASETAKEIGRLIAQAGAEAKAAGPQAVAAARAYVLDTKGFTYDRDLALAELRR